MWVGWAGYMNRLRRLCGQVAQAMWSGCAGYVLPRVDIESLVATKKFLKLVQGSFSLLQFPAQVIYFLGENVQGNSQDQRGTSSLGDEWLNSILLYTISVNSFRDTGSIPFDMFPSSLFMWLFLFQPL